MRSSCAETQHHMCNNCQQLTHTKTASLTHVPDVPKIQNYVLLQWRTIQSENILLKHTYSQFAWQIQGTVSQAAFSAMRTHAKYFSLHSGLILGGGAHNYKFAFKLKNSFQAVKVHMSHLSTGLQNCGHWIHSSKPIRDASMPFYQTEFQVHASSRTLSILEESHLCFWMSYWQQQGSNWCQRSVMSRWIYISADFIIFLNNDNCILRNPRPPPPVLLSLRSLFYPYWSI